MAGRRATGGARMGVHALLNRIKQGATADFLRIGTLEPCEAQTLLLEDFPSTDTARTLSPNGRPHWATKQRAQEAVARAVAATARRCDLRPVAGPVRLTLTYVYPDRRQRDIDNLTTGVTKCAIDALVRGRWLAGDDSRTVLSVTAMPVVERGRRALEITIEPAGEV